MTALQQFWGRRPNLGPAVVVEADGTTVTATAAPDAAVAWLWDYGDGTTSTLRTPPPKTYATPGPYTVTLTTTYSSGGGCGQYQTVTRTTAAPVVDSLWPQVVLYARFNGDLTDETGKVLAADGSVAFSTPGKFNGAVNINGSDGGIGGGNVVYLVTPSADLWLDGGDFTVEGWCKNSAAVDSRPRTLVRLAGSAGDYLQIAFEGNGIGQGTWRFSYRDGPSTSLPINSNVPAAAGQWMHLALTQQGNAIRGFVNGVMFETAPRLYRIASEPISCFIGNSQRSFIDALYGEIDEVRITKGTARYVAPFTPPARQFPNSGPP